MSLKDRYAIVGVGNTRVGKIPEMSDYGLQVQAAKLAMDDAGMTKADIDGMITHSHMLGGVRVHHQRVAQRLGMNTRFGVSISSGGSTSCMMAQLAAATIEAGMCEAVLCVHGDKSLTRGGDTHDGDKEFGPEYGMIGAAANHAFGLTRHMHEFGTTHDQLGAIAVAARKHAMLTPHAQIKKPMTLDDYHNSPWIVWPYHMFDCCLRSDGAAAFIVTSAERARDLKTRPVYIMGMGTANNSRGPYFGNHPTVTGGKESGEQAFSMAGLTPKDIDFAQIYDCFTYIAMVTLEDYGFCKKGEGGPFVTGGRIELGGELPMNTAGGMLSEGYVEGMLSIVEAVRQLRGECGERQVKDAEIGIVSGNGGNAVCHSTLILRR
jgi:acetyl-CoA acetyltransferase